MYDKNSLRTGHDWHLSFGQFSCIPQNTIHNNKQQKEYIHDAARKAYEAFNAISKFSV